METYKGLFPGQNQSRILGAIEHNHSASIMLELGDQWKDDPLIKSGIQAMALAALARKHDDKNLASSGIQAYSKALYSVNQSLQRPERVIRDNVLAACKLLAMYEIQRGVGFNWERHTLGTQQLLLARGPSKHTNGLAHTLFLDARLNIAIVGLKRREPTPLADIPWLQIPWSKGSKDSRQQLLDIMIQLPTILQEFDAIMAVRGTDNDTQTRRSFFFRRCRDFHYEAESWCRTLETGVGAQLYRMVKEGIPAVFPLDHFSFAHTVTLCWAFNIVLYGTLYRALKEIPESPTLTSETYAWCNPEPYAKYIANSVHYFFQPDAEPFSAAIFAFPMGVALNYFSYTYKGMHPEYLKIVEFLRRGKNGETTGKFLRTLQASTDPKKDPMKTFDQDENPSFEYEDQRARARNWYEKGEQVHARETTASQNND